MVKAARLFIAAAGIALFSVASIPAKEPAAYKIGERVEADITTPVSLVVIDLEATAELKAKEGERVPVIFRFYPQAGAEATAAFHKSFAQTRGNFLDAVEESFDARKLDADTLASTKFSRLVVSFQKKNLLFPVTTELARLWAAGEPDQEFEAPLLASLGGQMKNFIRATNSIPEGAKVGAMVRVVSYADTETLTAQMVARHGTNHPKTEFTSYPRAKADLQGTFPPEQHAAGKYLGSFIKPNCVVESDLTIALRAKRTEGLSVTANFAAGQVVAKRGQVMDEKTFAALTMLMEKTVVAAAASLLPAQPAPVSQNNFWLVGAAGGDLLAIISVLVLRRKKPGSLLPARLDGGSELSADSQDWQQRALAAERRADKAQTVIRTGLIAHLARWMSDSLVQKLLLQRAYLIETQQKAVTEVDKLGQRLDTIHSRMQGRLSFYEQRIGELEKELDTKDEINRELIQAEINKIRRQMDAERVKGEGGLN